MRIGSGEHMYEWIESWAKIPDGESLRSGWAHHGLATTQGGSIVGFHPGEPTLLLFDQGGELLRSWDSGLTNAHGMSLVHENGTEYLWLADNGQQRAPAAGYQYQPGSHGPQAAKMTLDGQQLMALRQPHLPAYREGRFSPTSVAVSEERFGGNGDIWLADGYGQHYVHRFTKAGDYVGSINGEEGRAGAFRTPHGVFVDRRRGEPELYIADRSNARVQVYDLDGRFKRVFGSDFLTTPSAFAVDGELLIIAELRARLTIVDREDRLVCYVGANEEVCQVPGWPNMKNEQDETVRTIHLQPGKFNSPHGITVDGAGNVYVAEWLIGGRYTKLVKC